MAKMIRRAGKIGMLVLVLVLAFGAAIYFTGRWAIAQTDVETAEAIEPDLFEAAVADITDSVMAGDMVAAAEDLQAFLADHAQDERYEEAIGAIADVYRHQGGMDVARGLYQYVLDMSPLHQQAFWADVWLTIMDIPACVRSCGQANVDNLFTKYAGDPRLGGAACLVADEYRRLNENATAYEWYQFAVEHWPQSEFALWSRMGSALSSLELGRANQARTEISILLADHFEDERIANAVCQIADAYRRRGDFGSARELYAYAVEVQPDAEHTFWCRMGYIISDIALGNDPNAARGTEQLFSKFPKDGRLANAACQIGDMYQALGRFQQAAEVHRHAAVNWPEAEHAIWCRKGLAVTEIHHTADPNVYAALDDLLVHYSGHPALPMAAFFVAEAYRDAAVSLREQGRHAESVRAYARAAGAFKGVIERVEPSIYSPESYYLLAECYDGMGKIAEAIACYQFIADTWPEWEMAWSARFLVGYKHSHLKKAGLINTIAADKQIRTAYSSLLAAYPNCPAAGAAANWLNRHGN